MQVVVLCSVFSLVLVQAAQIHTVSKTLTSEERPLAAIGIQQLASVIYAVEHTIQDNATAHPADESLKPNVAEAQTISTGKRQLPLMPPGVSWSAMGNVSMEQIMEVMGVIVKAFRNESFTNAVFGTIGNITDVVDGFVKEIDGDIVRMRGTCALNNESTSNMEAIQTVISFFEAEKQAVFRATQDIMETVDFLVTSFPKKAQDQLVSMFPQLQASTPADWASPTFGEVDGFLNSFFVNLRGNYDNFCEQASLLVSNLTIVQQTLTTVVLPAMKQVGRLVPTFKPILQTLAGDESPVLMEVINKSMGLA
eukprot:CAMPEP_0197925662 /NCGR_PEP_ID=MMETSP1439-20131203/97833_1 /TAXON_ID=66791 /ORGANISM="Gonyaulax spinifera, Strain CCMP409" /LENGTH=308 /DNA_ID=CAMNT_0043548149 /DNA_START=58 /DNA_END=981 /DNA_ORIENTATION=+